MRKGTHHSSESNLKNALAHQGKVMSQDARAKMSAAVIGKPKSIETRQRMSESAKHRPESHIAKIVAAISGSLNYGWTGDSASYRAVHKRLVKERGLADHCKHCGTYVDGKRFQWAYTGEGHDSRKLAFSANLDEYIQLCVPCHKRFDRKAD